ncbi:MAG: DUF1501 domain-containing protein [Myxococcota bacterium]
MRLDRRQTLRAALGAGGLGLRALATGLPASFLMGRRNVRAQMPTKPDFLILSSAQPGDPINTNAPGTYVAGAVNNPNPGMEETPIQLGGMATSAAAPWATLPEALRQRLQIFHHRTNTNAHPEWDSVLKFHGAIKGPSGNGEDMLPSALASLTAARLETIQAEPVALARERISFEGRPLDNIRPNELKSLFSDVSPLADLASLRDQELDRIYAEVKASGTAVQRRFIDNYASSRAQARQLGADLGTLLERLPLDPSDRDNERDQLLTAVALFRLNVTPAVVVRVEFGGDNHNDSDLTRERDQTIAAIESIRFLWNELTTADLQDRVTFATLNVFGRNFYRNSRGGRDHNGGHHAMVLFGRNVRPGVVGGLIPARRDDFHAGRIDPASGNLVESGGIEPPDTLLAAGKTLGRAMGIDGVDLDERIPSGTIVTGALR